MEWLKKGLVFSPSGDLPWSRSHAQVPFAFPVDGGRIRVYFGTRDDENQTLTNFIEVDERDPADVLYVNDEPVMELGEPGHFDSTGVMPASVVRDSQGRVLLYYTGWNRGGDVPFRVAMGRAVSYDGGLTFERVHEGPILDRSLHEPIAASQPFVLRQGEGNWRMYYLSYTRWEEVDDRMEPCYHIKTTTSSDGIHWEMPGTVCIDYDDVSDAISTPCVWKDDDGTGYHMLFSYRRSRGYREDRDSSYRMGYAWSPDGVEWQRDDSQCGIDRSEAGWDSEMIAYPNVFRSNGSTYLFYNGNGFGKTGFGLAELV